MKRILSVLLLVVLSVTTASALTACGGETYTITYHVEGTLPEGELAKAKPTSYKLSRDNIELWWPTVDESKYTFYGWYDNPEYSGIQIGDIPAASKGNAEFYGRVINNSGYSIKYIIDGVERTDALITSYKFASSDKDLWQPEPPDDSKYFSGWLEDPDDETATTVAQIPRNTIGDKVFYGEFITGEAPEVISVEFYFDGVLDTKATMETYTYSATRARQITYIPSYNSNEYGFKGWYTNPDFTGTPLLAIPAGTKPTEGPLKLYGRFNEPDGYGKSTGRVKALDFIAYFGDSTNLDEANKVTLDTYYGKKPLFLNFWSSKCGPCKAEMPDIQKVYAATGAGENPKIVFLMLNAMALSDTYGEAQAYVNSNGFTFKWIHDNGRGGNSPTTTYKVNSFPTSIIIDKWGYVAVKHVGGVTEASLLDMFAKVNVYKS